MTESEKQQEADPSPEARSSPGDLRNRTLPKPREPESTSTSWRDVIKDRLGTILGALLILTGIGVYAGWEPQVPRFWYIYGLSFVFLLPAGWFVATYAKSYFPGPQPDWVIDLDAREVDGAIVKFPPETLREFEVTEGELCQLAPNLYTARRVDLEAEELEGTWRGTMSDPDLLVALEAVYECRGALEDQARRGFAIEKRFFSILRNTTRDEVLSVVRTFEEGSLPDGSKNLVDHINSALEDHDLDDQIKTGADDFDLPSSVTEFDGDGPLVSSENGAGTDD